MPNSCFFFFKACCYLLRLFETQDSTLNYGVFVFCCVLVYDNEAFLNHYQGILTEYTVDILSYEIGSCEQVHMFEFVNKAVFATCHKIHQCSGCTRVLVLFTPGHSNNINLNSVSWNGFQNL